MRCLHGTFERAFEMALAAPRPFPFTSRWPIYLRFAFCSLLLTSPTVSRCGTGPWISGNIHTDSGDDYTVDHTGLYIRLGLAVAFSR